MGEERACEDMISALPEDLLVTILSLVPIKDAVATMILSKRWRFIWRMMTKLEYKENKDGKKSIWWFVEKSMELHEAPVLETLLIKLGPGCPSRADVGKCLAKAVVRGVVTLNLKLCWSSGPTRMPKSLYTSKTLTELTLSDKILLDVPSSSCLPSLVILELFSVVYESEASLDRFLSSCPVLKFLAVVRSKDDNVKKFTVKVPSLDFLSYCYDTTSLPDDGDVTERCLAIDSPALTRFWITDDSNDFCSIDNIPCLVEASIDCKSFLHIAKSETSLSAVLSLELFMTDDLLMHCGTINFSRLVKLSIFPCRTDGFKPLLLLLERAPKLKNLLVNYEFTLEPKGHMPLSWNQPSSVPPCLPSQLEVFEYRDYGGREEEKEFLTYIFANSKCLKTAEITARHSFNHEKRDLIIKELKNILDSVSSLNFVTFS